MYAEWTSLDPIESAEQSNWSVLYKFPKAAGKDVSTAVVRHLASNLGLNSTTPEQPSNLSSDREVLWCLEVLCFGLSLPLSETEAIKDCVNVYCEWLTALTKPNACVPKPVVDDPNNYGRRMMQHLFNLFVPRQDSTSDQIQRQILYCHRVLRCLQKIAHESTVMAEETWKRLLLLLLSVNDILLAPPPHKDDDLGDQLCERILGVLFEIWLISCHKCFPSPPLWKTFREMACKWRHRPVLIDQWNKVNIVLTSRTLNFMFGSSFPELKCGEEDCSLVSADMDNNCVAQTWFRCLHLIGNPVDLCKPGIISQTPRFFHYALSSQIVIDPWQHQCLVALPHIFLKAMKGIAILVNSFLGIPTSNHHIEDLIRGDKVIVPTATSASSSTPPGQKKISKSLSTGTALSKNQPKSSAGSSASKVSTSQASTSTSSQPSSAASTPNSTAHNMSQHALSFSQEAATLSANSDVLGRPRCNSVLHLFGAWLFEAALLGCKIPEFMRKSAGSNYATKRTMKQNSVFFDQKTSSVGMSSLPDTRSMPEGLTFEKFEAGQAEAIGALCHIFCAKKTNEDVLPVYLARFYLAIKLNLCEASNIRGQVVSSILLNSHSLFVQDLDGVHILYPAFVAALEMVLPDAVPTFRLHQSVQVTELRRAAIEILLSLLCLPLHFQQLAVKDILKNKANESSSHTFQSLKPRLINLIINAITVETDPLNTQMLLGGLLLFVQDCAALEKVQHDASNSECRQHVDSRRASSSSMSPPSPLHFDPESLEYPDFDSLSVCDCAHALFLRATYLVCHKLISSWKTDLNVSLAAIELLAGLAKIKMDNQESLECKRAVKWISDFIVYQCSRPPPAHSKDLHSTIVAAYNCLTIWLVEHPYLLKDKECLVVTMEVIELGICGSKSQPKPKDVPKMKADKENKPVSMRVREAAEFVLNCVMTQVGYFPSACGPQSLSSLVNEDELLKQCNNANKFKYYAIDNSIIVAVLEQPLVNAKDGHPTVTVVSRGPFGRKAWMMQQRHVARHMAGAKSLYVNPGRPMPMEDVGVKSNVSAQYFPDSIDRIASYQIDKSIPTLESVINNDKQQTVLNLINNQIKFEQSINDKYRCQQHEYLKFDKECSAPPLCQDLQTARLFLSQFGLLSLDSLKESMTHPFPSLVLLDDSQSHFHDTLAHLDKMSDRTSDTVFVFYMKSNQRKPQDILQNVMNKSSVNGDFVQFLLSLGWPVDVAKHSGWTGHVSTSWKIPQGGCQQSSPVSQPSDDHGGALFNGQKQVLYWSDVSSEVAFIVPSASNDRKPSASDSTDCDAVANSPQLSVKSFDQENADSKIDSRFRAFSLDLDRSAGLTKSGESRSSGRKYGRQGSSAVAGDAKVLVVWLESYEDHAYFPINDMLRYTSTGLDSSATTPRSADKDLFVIYIHALQSGLYRIKVQGSMAKTTVVTPLVDGMMVSRRVLASMVRQTALNMCRRRRLELDSYQPAHMRRRLVIQDIVHKYTNSVTQPQFYCNLFSSV